MQQWPVPSCSQGCWLLLLSLPTEARNQLGGFTGYVQDQVEYIIDTLHLSMTDFTFQLKLPAVEATGTLKRFPLEVMGSNSNS